MLARFPTSTYFSLRAHKLLAEMQPTVYFLNRGSKLHHLRRQRDGVWTDGFQCRAERPGTESTRRVMNKSHSLWTFLWRYHGSDTEPFHLIALKCPGDMGNSDTCKWIYCICMQAVLCCVRVHHNPVDHTSGISIHPLETLQHPLNFSKLLFVFFSSPARPRRRIRIPGDLTWWPSDETMTAIKQLGPARPRGRLSIQD